MNMNEMRNRAKNVAWTILALLAMPYILIAETYTDISTTLKRERWPYFTALPFLALYLIVIPIMPLIYILQQIPLAFLLPAKEYNYQFGPEDKNLTKYMIRGLPIGLILALTTGLMIAFPPFGLASVIGTGGTIAQAMGLASLGAAAFPILMSTLILAVVINLYSILNFVADRVRINRHDYNNVVGDDEAAAAAAVTATGHHSISQVSQSQRISSLSKSTVGRNARVTDSDSDSDDSDAKATHAARP